MTTQVKTSSSNQNMNKILIVFGTRPELIKLAPVIDEFTKRNQRESLYIVNSNQHEDFIMQDIGYFQIDIDHQFKLTRKNECLSYLNGLLLLEFHELKLKLSKLKIKPDAIIAQGDTCTSYTAALFSFYENIPFIHVEAGLRTYDFNQPFPEEYYRKTISSIANIHFAPTLTAKQNLIAEGFDPTSIIVTGNTVIDNLTKYIHGSKFQYNNIKKEALILITIHRRENINNNLKVIINRIVFYCQKHPDKSFLWIDNPGYKIENKFENHIRNLKIIQPVSFLEMMNLYKKAELIITDSGGIQEEAGYLGIPTLIFRNKTERIEGIQLGISKYFEEKDNDLNLVISTLKFNGNTKFNTIYGDGYASKRIVDFMIDKRFEQKN